MSVETTNTPNGASKDLMSENKQEIVVNILDDMRFVDNKDLNNWEVPGDGIKGNETQIIDVSSSIRDNGSVRIGVTLVGQPMISGQEAKTSIKDQMKILKEAILKRKGVLSNEAYIEAKKARAERGDEAGRYH